VGATHRGFATLAAQNGDRGTQHGGESSSVVPPRVTADAAIIPDDAVGDRRHASGSLWVRLFFSSVSWQ
jgi:hypothetical protein